MRAAGVRRGAEQPGLLLGGAHLAVLWAFAFAQPLFDLLSKNPEFFVARHNGAGDIVFFAFCLVFVPPIAAILVEALLGVLSTVLRTLLHLGLVALLVAAITLQVEKGIVSRHSTAMIAFALAIGLLAAFAYWRWAFAPQVLSVLMPAPIVFLAIFLLFSGVSKLIGPQEKAKLAPAASIHSSVPVVVLFFDEFPVTSIEAPDGRIDARRYPGFAELAAHSTWYPNATTVADYTSRAIPALLTGINPSYKSLPTFDDHPNNLFTLLGAAYRLHAIESVTSLCPASLCTGNAPRRSFIGRFQDLASDLSLVSEHLLLPDQLRAHLPPIDQTFGGFRGGGLDKGQARPRGAQGGVDASQAGPADRAALFKGFLKGIGGDSRMLHFLHVEIPHRPFQYLPSGQSYPLPPRGTGELQDSHGLRIPSDSAAQLSWQRHLLQVGYADNLLSRLIARLKKARIWDTSIVVVAADHGMAFIPGQPPRTARSGNVGQIAGIPLFVKGPGQIESRVSRRPVCTTDVLPMIAGLLRSKLRWKTDACAADPANGAKVSIRTGDRVTLNVPFDFFARARRATDAEKASLFGSGDPAGLFDLGQARGLIGVPVARLGRPLDFRFADPSLFRDVDPAGSSVPSLVQAKTSQAIAESQPLAVAVNGRIAAITRAIAQGHGARILAIVPPQAFRPGPNRLTVYKVSG
jgi:hypothetical protein